MIQSPIHPRTRDLLFRATSISASVIYVMKLLVLLVLPFASAFKLPISPKLSATAVTLAAPLPALAVYEPIHKVLPGTECE